MNYSSFCETLKQMLMDSFQEKPNVIARQIRKNNGLVYDTLCVLNPGSRCSPAIYLNPLYDGYKRGLTLQEILSHILSALEKHPPLSPELLDGIQNYNLIKEKIAFRLISRESNEELLGSIPWFPYLDLAVIFYLYLGRSEDGQMSSIIGNEQLELWGVSAGALWDSAQINSPLLFPASLRGIEDVLLELPETEGAAEGPFAASLSCHEPAFYVLTNRDGIYGASCLLYEGIIKDFAERVKSDLLVLPSSIHEVLLLADTGGCDRKSLDSMVRQINAEDVSPEDRLSDHAYFYSRAEGSLTY